MPYYHVSITYRSGQNELEKTNEIGMNVYELTEMVKLYAHGQTFLCGSMSVIPFHIHKINIYETADRAGWHTVTGPWNYINKEGKDVTRRFIKSPPSPQKVIAKKLKKTRLPSKEVFIVHGRDHKPMRELKTMLYDFGLKSIVLHEQPSGSMTVVEKLEKYSDVGYTFVLLTPDDALVPTTEFIKVDKKHGTITPTYFFNPPPIFRARQNVILEFGYFIAKVGRNRVCCLYKEDTQLPYDLPSDMHGIVYISFKESISEKKDMIIKELKEAGYEIREVSEETKKESS